MEHLNRRLKSVIRAMGANVSPTAIQKSGKAVASLNHVCQQFELQTTSHVRSHNHLYPSFGKDFVSTTKALEDESVFFPSSVRQHSSCNFRCGLLEMLTTTDLLKKVEASIEQIVSVYFFVVVTSPSL